MLVSGAVAFVLIRQERLRRHMIETRDQSYVALEEARYEDALHQSGTYINYAGRDEPRPLFTYARAREEVESPNNRHLSEAVSFYQQYLTDFPGAERAQTARRRLARLYLVVGAWDELLDLTSNLDPNVTADDEDRLEQLRLRASALAARGRLEEAFETADAYLAVVPLDAAVLNLAIDLQHAIPEAGADAAAARLASLREAHGDDPRVDIAAAADAARRNDRDELVQFADRAAEAVLDGSSLAAFEGGDEARALRQLMVLLDASGLSEKATRVLATAAARVTSDVDAGIARLAANRLALAGEWEALLDLTRNADPVSESELTGLRGLAMLELDQPANELIESLEARPEGSSARAWSSVLSTWQTQADRRSYLRLAPASGTSTPLERLESSEAALSVYGHPTFALQRAEALLDLEEPIGATDVARQLLSTGPSLRPMVLLAQASASSGDLETTSAVLAAMRARFAEDPIAVSETAMLLLASGNVGEATRLLEEVEGDDLLLVVLREALASQSLDAQAVAELDEGLVLRLMQAMQRSSPNVAAALIDQVRARPDIDPMTAAFVDVLTGSAVDDESLPPHLKLFASRGSDDFVDGSIEIAEAAADAETVDMLLVQTIWRLNALRADDLQQWTLLRRLTAAAAEAIGETGANWPVRLARLDLAKPDGEVEEAVLRDRAIDLGAVTRGYPAYAEGRLILAAVLDRLDVPDEAEAQLVAAVEAAPRNTALRLELATRLAARNEPIDLHLRQLESQTDRLTRPQLARLMTLLEQEGQYERVLALMPDEGDRLTPSRLTLLARAGRLDAETIEQAAASEDPSVVVFAAEALARLNRVDDALAATERLATLIGDGPSDLDVELIRGSVLLAGGRLDEAATVFLSRARETNSFAAWRLGVLATLSGGGVEEAASLSREASQQLDSVGEDHAVPFELFADEVPQSVGLLNATSAPASRLRETLVAVVDRPSADRARLLVEAVKLIRDMGSEADVGEVADRLDTLRRDPLLADVRSLLELSAIVDTTSGRTDRAIQTARAAARADRRNPEPQRLLVDALAAENQLEAAIEAAMDWRERLRQQGAADQAFEVVDVAIARLELAAGRPAVAVDRLQRVNRQNRSQRLIALEAEARIANSDPGGAVETLGGETPPPTDSPLRATWLRAAALAASTDDARGRRGLVNAADAVLGVPDASVNALLEVAVPISSAVTASGDRQLLDRLAALVTRVSEQVDDNAGPAVWERIGILAGSAGVKDLSRSSYERALRDEPGRVIARNNLAMLLLEGSDSEVAEAERLVAPLLTEDRVRESAAFPAILDTRAAIAAKLGNVADAIEYIQRAIEQQPEEPEWHVHLAEMYVLQGELREASTSARQAERAMAVRTTTAALRDRLNTVRQEVSAASRSADDAE
ncbi:MAG: tetratricopeptide repeat protein [Planctomycetota bacterium]